MDSATAMDLLREGILVALKIGAPMLLISMVIGVLVAIFQAVTQIHEQTLTFLLKMAVVVTVLLIGGGRMMELLQDFTRTVFLLMME